MKDREKDIRITKTLIKTGALITSVGGITIVNGIVAGHGELGSVGALIGGAGVALLLTASRRRKI